MYKRKTNRLYILGHTEQSAKQSQATIAILLTTQMLFIELLFQNKEFLQSDTKLFHKEQIAKEHC